ncbi:MAG: cupin domain-containing protein [Acidimicrobiales bacterium]
MSEDTRPAFPGAIAASHLRVYETLAPDGLAGGTPHLHTACTEAYYVVAGSGSVQTLTAEAYREVPLAVGALCWFTPGTIHRLVNDGGLEILVLMQNAGLPEAGDMVITMPPDVLSDAALYAEAVTLPEHDRTTAGPGDAARMRRDLAVSAFVELRQSSALGDTEPLATFHRAAARLVRPHVAAWTDRWAAGPMAEALRTRGYLDALTAGNATHLAEASVHLIPPPAEQRRMGCCGTLGTFLA